MLPKSMQRFFRRVAITFLTDVNEHLNSVVQLINKHGHNWRALTKAHCYEP